MATVKLETTTTVTLVMTESEALDLMQHLDDNNDRKMSVYDREKLSHEIRDALSSW